MASPFFNAHTLHRRFFQSGVMARFVGLIVLLAALLPQGASAAVGYWSGSYAACDSLQTKSFSTYVNCAVDQVEISNPFASCPNFWADSTAPVAMVSGGNEIYRGSYIVYRHAYTGSPSPSCQDQVQRSSGNASMTLNHCVAPQQFDPELGECFTPVEDDCSEFTGQSKGVKWPDSGGVNPGSTLCKNTPNGKNCAMTAGAVAVCLGGSCYNSYTYSGSACSSAPPPVEAVEAADNEKGECVSVAGGSACVAYERDAQNCGTFNGQSLCLGKVPEGKCLFVGGTGVACDSAAGSPPAPDDGVTPGVPALPVAEIQTRDSDGNVTNNYSVYSQTQVNNSTGGVTGSYGDNSGTGLGDGEGEGGGGSGSSSGSCSIEPSCEGDPIQCAILRQSWLSRCYEPVSDSEAGALVGGSGGVSSEIVEIGSLETDVFGVESATCPADQEITVFGASLALPWSFACQLAGYMRPLILLMAYLQSAYIVFGAFRNS